ncbi:hypothetical protein DH86_00001793 [Scytalidium sp. 3C]|nr:hypothetical protein DH86_00001793 [Scytalidium sp. 3C]
MMPHGAYDDGELEISLAPSSNRRTQNKQPDATSRRDPNKERRSAEQPPPQKKAEQRIGAYQIIRTLGEGSFGKVKLAVHRVTNQQVALKIIARKKLISRDMAGRVEREIEYLQLLRHPHIIKLCGVILYVLLVGRLPFDDEHIPSLFAKIAKGQYVVPNYMSAGAASLIKKMLAVNPVHRATIEEIRQDPWFLVNLPAYLKPPPEEFFDTGVDPSKAINPRAIAPHATPAVQEKLHEQVTEKISKTMGYGIKDVQEALAAEEPSAIKDAYLIVRENKLMEANPLLADEKGQLLFQASSPPPWNDGTKSGSDSPAAKDRSSVSPLPLSRPSPLLDSMSPRSSTSAGTERSIRPYVSKVGILPSSLPAYHRDYMQAKKAGRTPVTPSANTNIDTDQGPQTEADKLETARRLNPHSRSQIKLDEASKRPIPMTPVPQKKAKPTKWQFGIRSRNQPLEAIGCIYRALQKLGAEWIVDEDGGDSRSIRDEDNRFCSLPKFSSYADSSRNHDGSFVSEASGASLHHSNSLNGNIRFQSASSVNYKLPADPWVLHEAASSPKHNQGHVDTQSVVMYMDIQLYEMESGVYLVDFKCAGYETPDGALLEEKDVTSPFPFLDLASKLIIQLAEAD